MGNSETVRLTLDKELGEVNETEYVGLEHGFNVILSNVTNVFDAKDEACVVDYHLDVSSHSGES